MIKSRLPYEEVQINLVPMIDMFLFLIIFFLTATSFSQMEREQEVLLPQNSNRTSLSREADRKVVINVLQDGALRFLGRPASAAELEAGLRQRRERAPAPLQVLVRADRRTAYGNVALALAAVERAGIERPSVVTRWVEIEE